MNNLPKIYTKKGDKGMTSLLSGENVPKDHQRLEVCGSIDELNCQIGFAESLIDFDPTSQSNELLKSVQKQLFTIGAEIAVAGQTSYAKAEDLLSWIENFEKAIDHYSQLLPELRAFILPGGSSPSGALHICRSVCRRAEREIVKLSSEQTVPTEILTYINRLSDLLFILSRYVLKMANKEETVWKQP